MKSIISFILLCASLTSISQVYEYSFYDKAKINQVINNEDGFIDTTAWIINDTVNIGTSTIYYDAKKLLICSEFKVTRNEKSITRWYRNGQLKEKSIFYFGKLNISKNNISDGWYPDGSKKFETKYDENLQTTKCYYPNNKIKSIYIGKLDAKLLTYGLKLYKTIYNENWCANGTLISKDSIPDRKIEKKIIYYCDGKKAKEYFSFGNIYFGTYTEWYENGQIKVQGFYDPIPVGKTIPKSTKEQGNWVYYWESGDLIKMIKYKNGQIVQ